MNSGYRYRHVLGAKSLGHTAISYLASTFEHSSLDQWRKRLDEGEVELDGSLAVAETVLKPGGVLIWNRPPWQEPDAPRSYKPVFVDSHILVVDKPSGLPTIPGGGFLENTLVNIVRVDFPEAIPVHRLGRATSGLVVMARSKEIAARITKNWNQQTKTYRALVSGLPNADGYDCNAPIGPCFHPSMGRVYAASADGKPSRSVFRILHRRDADTLVEVDLHTGRPHQIRIHAAFLMHPLVGDPLYGVGGIPLEDSPGVPGDPGYLLHAHRLRFSHPITAKTLELEAELPKTLTILADRHNVHSPSPRAPREGRPKAGEDGL